MEPISVDSPVTPVGYTPGYTPGCNRQQRPEREVAVCVAATAPPLRRRFATPLKLRRISGHGSGPVLLAIKLQLVSVPVNLKVVFPDADLDRVRHELSVPAAKFDH
jgi:hypothetical protein